MKYYHVLIAKEAAEKAGDTSTRKVYTSKKQSVAPAGWVCLGNLGYFEKPGKMESTETMENYDQE